MSEVPLYLLMDVLREGRLISGRGTTRAEDAQGTPTQSHISPSVLVYEKYLLGDVLREGRCCLPRVVLGGFGEQFLRLGRIREGWWYPPMHGWRLGRCTWRQARITRESTRKVDVRIPARGRPERGSMLAPTSRAV